ncbi:TPA: hypothetical protein ACSE6S_000344 [Acinetobacter baumannii]|uniref:hypothetical protein n=5 Tax=Acinetobacter baumannii TaxID=470 RepID=UPI0002CEA800|nr:hypothetical protein [Acinetobacter baumannii]ENU65009.1 hypothetical protein F979_03086 [Acinetobacter baumannii NIPH 146]EXA70290.1 hypothetical protein J503_0505 [Acinetobacter baumannii 984213]MDM8387698.1 hypothetical protein [Acinetobacter baumannii]CDG77851.1 hypothetical protein ABICBIBUN_04498 [Acinetobacter baumannii 107m]HAV3586318.1 hypothetical protein [Acinetobacter baumannii]
MKPEQFIRDFGEKKAREVVEGAPGFPVFGYCTLTGNYIFKRSNATAYYHNETNSWSEDYAIELILLEDLKRLVESLDIIEFHEGISGAKLVYKLRPSDAEGVDLWVRLERAIKDHESIYGGGHV